MESVILNSTIEGTHPKSEYGAQFAVGRYKKRGSAGIRGLDYQIGLLVVVLLNALKNLTNWRLSTENESAGKFDDVVVEWPEGAILIQAKHREKKKKRITLEELMSTNSRRDEFSLPKYFLSYHSIKNNFIIKDITICTNADVHSKVLPFLNRYLVPSESILHHQLENCSFYTFNDEIIPILKQATTSYFRQNFQAKDVEESVITDENLKDFLEHLQIYFNYPPEDNLDRVVERLLSLIACSSMHSASELTFKIKQWFLQKEEEYFSEMHAKAALAEIHSDKYLQKLKQLNVSFKNNNFNLKETAKVFQIIPQVGYLLQVLKIVGALQDQKSRILCTDPKDAIETLKQAIEAFTLPSYTTLLINWSDDMQGCVSKEISEKLKKTLNRYHYKRVILVGHTNLVKQLGFHDCCNVIKESVKIKDLSQDTQELLLKRKNILFQGRNVSLEKLFARQVTLDTLPLDILEKFIRDKKIKVGSELRPLDGSIAPYYVSRIFEREIPAEEDEKLTTVQRRETFSEEELCGIKYNSILIQGDAGAGKSTVLVHLANTIKNRHPDLWVVLIKLNDYTGILSEFKENNKDSISIKDLMNSRSTTKLNNELEEMVFFGSETVVLMIDGVDEISPDYTELVLNLLNQCQIDFDFVKVFVTTRPHMAGQLEEILNATSFKLKPFTHQNQVSFLTNYWCHNLKLDESNRKRCERYAKELLKKTSFLTNMNNEHHFAAMPLQVMMLAEIFEEDRQQGGLTDWEGCKEFLTGKEEFPKLLRKVNVVEIYKMFIEKKQTIYKTKGNPSGNAAANQALLYRFDECLVYHRSLALQDILQESEYKLFSDYRNSDEIDECTILRMGIVQKLQNTFYFSHRTFAEYFVAESIIRELQRQIRHSNKKFYIIFHKILVKSVRKLHKKTEFQKFFFDQILLTPRFKVVRTFFNGFLQPVLQSLPCDMFQCYESLSYKIDLDASYNLVSELTKEGCAAILQLLFKCIRFEIVKDKEVKKEDILKNRSKSSNALKVLKFLARQGGVNIRDGFYRKPLSFAFGSNDMEMIKFLVSHGATVSDSILYDAIYKNQVEIVTYFLEKIIERGGSLAGNPFIPYTLCYLGRTDQLSSLVENGLDVNHRLENGESLIFGAVRGSQLDTIRYLLQQGADINSLDRGGNSALHLIEDMPYPTSTAELLVQLGIDINAKDFSGITALHMGTRNIDIVKFLVNNGADVNSKDTFGKTALCKAIQQSHWDSAKFLVTQGCNTYIRDKEGRKAIHYAAEQGQLDMIQTFMKRNVSIRHQIMDKDAGGWVPLHFAAVKGRFETVKYLVEHSADVNDKNNESRTPLHLAAWRGHFQTVKYLVQHNADVNVKDSEGRTALHLAALECQLEVVEYLSELCADINAKDNQGCTVLHLAAWKCGLERFRYLWGPSADCDGLLLETPFSFIHRYRNICTKTAKLLIEKGADADITDSNGDTVFYLIARNMSMLNLIKH